VADISITAGNVSMGANGKWREGLAGATITAGQVLYEDSSDSFSLKLADADASAAAANPVGIALNGGADGQPIRYVYEDDDFTPGGTLDLSGATSDGVLVLSGTAGAMCPSADIAAGDYPVVLGVVKSATKMNLKIVRGTAVMTA
jgi:hypothetical protein